MNLKIVSAHNFASLQDAYSTYSKESYKEETYKRGWIEIIQHLEEIEGSDHWVMASKYDLCFMSGDTQEPSRVRVKLSSECHLHSSPTYHSEFYEISYRLPDGEVPWQNIKESVSDTWMRGYAKSVKAAGRMIMIALERATQL